MVGRMSTWYFDRLKQPRSRRSSGQTGARQKARLGNLQHQRAPVGNERSGIIHSDAGLAESLLANAIVHVWSSRCREVLYHSAGAVKLLHGAQALRSGELGGSVNGPAMCPTLTSLSRVASISSGWSRAKRVQAFALEADRGAPAWSNRSRYCERLGGVTGKFRGEKG